MMKNCLFCMVLTGMLMVLAGRAAIADIYVATNGTHGVATNWTTAYTNIQTALDAAATNEAIDTIYLAGSNTFYLTSQLVWANNTNVTIRGGYAATNDTALPGARDPNSWPTVLLRSVTNRFRILNVAAVTNGVLDGLTFTGGYPADGECGGGIRITNSVLTLVGCVISNNKVYIYYIPAVQGGGLYASNSTVILSNCLVGCNQSFNGYGAVGCLTYGGGLFFEGGQSTLLNTIIRANRAQKTVFETFNDRGGGIGYRQGTHRIHNCAIAGNIASGFGSGILVENAATRLTIENTTITGNTGGAGLDVLAGVVAVTNSILWHNDTDISGTVQLAYCNTEDGVAAGENGNISADPQFERGLYLAPDSLSINAGTGTVASQGLDGTTTLVDGSPDAGIVDQGFHFQSGLDMTAADYYVSTNGQDSYTGTNWSEAFRSVTHALSVARDGTRIHIASGLYTNEVSGDEQFPLVIADRWGVQLLGSGDSSTVFNVVSGVRQRLLDTELTAGDALISGLTFTGGYPPDGQWGGAIRVMYGALQLSDCTVSNNESYLYSYPGPYGGGLYAREARLTLERCRFMNNRARNGYGAVGAGKAEGGGIYLWRGMSTILATIWTGNRAYKSAYENQFSRGGAVQCNGGRHQIFSSLIVSNEATGIGGAIYSDAADVALVNLTVVNNLSSNWALYVENGGVAVTNSIFWGNTNVTDVTGSVALAYCNLQSGLSNGVNGNISADPQFVGPATNNYRLGSGSPCINTGINQAWMAGATDLGGEPRINTKTVDMGAYEVQLPPSGTVFMCQ